MLEDGRYWLGDDVPGTTPPEGAFDVWTTPGATMSHALDQPVAQRVDVGHVAVGEHGAVDVADDRVYLQ